MQLVPSGTVARRPAARVVQFAKSDSNVVVVFAIVQNLLRAISAMILTRLLVPEAFGLTGILGVIGFTVAMVSDLGFQPFVVRHEKGDSPGFLDTIWTIGIIRSAILTTTLIALAEPIAALFAKPELAPMIEITALGFIIDGLASLTLLTAIRHKQILRLSLLELAIMVIQIGVSVVLAWLWRDVWAVLVASLVSSVSKSLLSYVFFPNARRRLAFDPVYARELWRFARYVTGSSMITLIVAQCDKLVLARLMPLNDFGLYILAGNLAAAPLMLSSAYTSRVLYPSYAEQWRKREADLRGLFYAKKWTPSLLYTFAAGGLIGCAPLVVAALYDDRYLEAALYLQLLAIAPFFAFASSSAAEALTATGHVSVHLHAGIIKLIWLALATPAAYLTEGTMGLVAVIGLMELPPLLLKWFQLGRIGLLDLSKEMIFIGLGLCGIATGWVISELLSPLFR